MCQLLLLAALLVALPAGAVAVDWVHIGDPGNPPDTATNCLDAAPDCGSVPYGYFMSTYEVTNAEYAAFLNAVGSTDTYELYDTIMNDGVNGGITRSGTNGSYTYAVKPGFEQKPVVYVSFYDSLRFANWLHNAQPTGAQGAGTTEDGAYTFSGLTTVGARNLGALAFLPTENEWYEAAYYDPELDDGAGGYWDYPTDPVTQTGCVEPASDTGNSANCGGAVVGALTEVGAYTQSEGPYGTFDQGGNVYEWNETASDADRIIRGGAWGIDAPAASSEASSLDPAWKIHDVGFRVAPEPAHLLLVLTGGLVLRAAAWRRRV